MSAVAARKAYFGRRYLVSASHRLHSPELTADENRETFGQCNNPNGHGHNYFVEVLVGGEVDRETGMVINLTALDEAVKARSSIGLTTQISIATRSFKNRSRRRRIYAGRFLSY